MKVFFSVVAYVLIYSHRTTSAQESNTTTPWTITSTGPQDNSTPTSETGENPATPDSSTTTTWTTSPENSSTTTEISATCSNPSPPKNQSIIVNKTFANITWTTNQEDNGCIPEYLNVSCVALEEDNMDGWEWVTQPKPIIIKIGSNPTDVQIENLSEFTNYTCNGTLAMSDGQTSTTSFRFKTIEEVSSPPLNLTVTGITRPTIISVKWEKPAKNPGIFINYQVQIFSDGPSHFVPESCGNNVTNFSNTTTIETFTFMHLHADYNYTISVFVNNNAGKSGSISTFERTPIATSEQIREFSSNEIELNEEANIITYNISWKMPCEPNGPINHFEIYLEGHYVLDDLIVDNRKIIVNTSDIDEEYSKTIDLQFASQYEISIRANGETKIGSFYNETIITEDNIPGIPRPDNITEKGSTFFVISWVEPERKAGNITSYYIEVVSLMPMYDRDKNKCPFLSEVVSDMLSGDIQTYNFTKGHPYFKYNISITASTSKGAGESSIIIVETETSVPEKPDNVTFALSENNLTGLLSWKVPCNINGPLKVFDLTINGTYTDDSSIHDNYTQLIPFQDGNYNYSHTINLAEAYTYDAYIRLVLEDGTDGEAHMASVTTPDGYPGVPLVHNATEVNVSSFTVTWEPPIEKTGKINYYILNITSLGPLYNTSCPIDKGLFIDSKNGSTRMFEFTRGQPYYRYSISITANTSKGFGNSSEKKFVITKQSIPEAVQNASEFISDPTDKTEEYNAYATISFKEPCYINGPLKHYELNVFGSRPHYNNHTELLITNNTSFILNLKPEYNYSYSINTLNNYYNSSSSLYNFMAPAGVPKFSSTTMNLNIKKGSTDAHITLKEEYFDTINGDIKYVALILSEENITGGSYSRWDGINWPLPNINDKIYYQLSTKWWNPFLDGNNITITIGNDTNCNELQNPCNRPLEKNKDYYLIIRIFTSNFYRNSHTIYFRTDDISKLGMILGIIFGLLFLALLGLAGFFVWKKNIVKFPPLFYHRKSSNKSSSTASTTIPINKFMQYCKNLENNPEKLAEQYSLLAEKTKEAVRMQTTVYAELTENRRKNRYTNILPYDETRVKLLIDEDDEIGSDYINASYIRGYSGNVEYIATQGPLPTTCRDFWKMVVQENVSIIVMVTQFVEQNKEKCYKYFPNNHESMIIGEDMEVKCSMELHFGTYCVRTLQVKKDTTQVTVTHMQYLDWPDFNVPKGTENMLQFCYQLRDRLKIEGGCVIIHCSAGVGRTGTLIATDILLQNVNAGKNIDVFNTVLELRKQRTHMVQTQKQYMYIHNLIKDDLDQSQTSGINENSEPLYENVSVLKTKADDDNLIAKDKETESQF